MKNKITIIILAFCFTFVFAGGGYAQETHDVNAIARELANPIGRLASLVNKFQYTEFTGSLPGADNQEMFLHIFQPVIPAPLSGNKMLIFRPVITMNYDTPTFDAAEGRFEDQTGLGDMQFLTLYGATEENGLIWGIGPTFDFPTATDDALGDDQWEMGPAGLLAMSGKWGLVGGLLQHWWDVGGPDKPDTSLSALQLIYWFSLGDGWQVGGSPIITYDWEASGDNNLTVPIGLGVSKTLKIGKMPIKFSLEYQYAVESPDGIGTDWSVIFSITPVIPSPFAKRGQ